MVLKSRQPSHIYGVITIDEKMQRVPFWDSVTDRVGIVAEAATYSDVGRFSIAFELYASYRQVYEEVQGPRFRQRRVRIGRYGTVLPFSVSNNGKSFDDPFAFVRDNFDLCVQKTDAWQRKNRKRLDDEAWRKTRANIVAGYRLALAPSPPSGAVADTLRGLLDVYYDDPEATWTYGAPASGSASEERIETFLRGGDTILVWGLLAERLLRAPEYTTNTSPRLAEAQGALREMRAYFEQHIDPLN